MVIRLSHPVLVLSSFYISILLSYFMLGPAPTHLKFSILQIFKKALSNEHWNRCSTSPSSVEPLHLFLTLGLLPEKNDCKQSFDMAFINSCSLVENYAAKEMDQSFENSGYFLLIRLNWFWQFELLDCKLIYIIDVIFQVVILFWNLLFIPCLCYTMKLASKLGLRIWTIASRVVKEKIKLVNAYKIIRQLD